MRVKNKLDGVDSKAVKYTMCFTIRLPEGSSLTTIQIRKQAKAGVEQSQGQGFRRNGGFRFRAFSSLASLIGILLVSATMNTVTGQDAGLDPQDEIAKLPVPLTAKDLHNLEPIDSGEIQDEIPSTFHRAAVVALVSLGEIDDSRIRKPMTPEEEIANPEAFREKIESGESLESAPVNVTADVVRLEVIKGDNEDNITSLLIDKTHLFPMRRRYSGGPVENRWVRVDLEKNQHFLVFSGQEAGSLVSQLQNPSHIESIAEDKIDAALRELRFLKGFAAKPVAEQLKLPGLSDYLESGGVMGQYLGSHMGMLYEWHPPSVRPNILPVIESMKMENVSAVGLTAFGYHQSPSWSTEDAVGSGILSMLKSMSSFDGEELGDEASATGSIYQNFHKFLQRNQKIATEVLERDSVVEQIELLKIASKKWYIRTTSDERVLLSVMKWIELLEELK